MTNSEPSRLDRIEAILENLAERQVAFQDEMNANHEAIGAEIGQLTRGIAELKQQVSTLATNAERDREQFRGVVERLLQVLTNQINGNGREH